MQGVGIFFGKVDHGTRFGQIVVPVEIETGRDRNGTFESGLGKKRNDPGRHVSVQYHGMYGLGMSVREHQFPPKGNV